MKKKIVVLFFLLFVMVLDSFAQDDLGWPRDQYNGPGGGLYTGPGGGMYIGPCSKPFMSNIPPWDVFIEYLDAHGMKEYANKIRSHMP